MTAKYIEIEMPPEATTYTLIHGIRHGPVCGAVPRVIDYLALGYNGTFIIRGSVVH